MSEPLNDAEENARWVLLAILAATAVRLFWVATSGPPPHFDEAQYWTYGEELAWSYYSKPPLVAWLIRVGTEVFGDTLFGLRVFAPLCHALVTWMIFATARRLFEGAENGGRIGFWSAIGYLLIPGVSVSSGLMTTDPVMMACWSVALYAMVRAMTEDGALWWLLSGLAIGVGLLGKYTMIAFPLSALGYALFSRRGDLQLRAGMLMAGAALVGVSGNLIWNIRNGFATIAHVGDNANLGGSLLNPGKMLEFIGAQVGVFGPIFFAVLLLIMLRTGTLRKDWRFRLLLWMTMPLLAAMTLQALVSRAHPNWAAPAYVGGTILVCAYMIRRSWDGLLQISAAVCLGLWALLWTVGGLYNARHVDLPRAPDPYKKMRAYDGACGAALAALQKYPEATLLGDDRRLLAVCMFRGGIPQDEIAIWAYGPPTNHYAMVSPLKDGDERAFVYISGLGEPNFMLSRFEGVEKIAEVPYRTHRDRVRTFYMWRLEGFTGYGE